MRHRLVYLGLGLAILLCGLVVVVALIERHYPYRVVIGERYVSNEEMTYLEAHQSSILMHIIPDKVSRETIQLKLLNHTDNLHLWGLPFSLLIEYGENWRYVEFLPSRDLFSHMAHFLHPHSYVKHTIQLSDHFGRLPIGNFRIVKDVRNSETQMTIAVVGSFTLP